MTGTVILLIILGLLFIFGSYIFSEKIKNSSDDEVTVKIPKELSDEQKAKIQKMVDEFINISVDSKLEEVEGEFSKIVNEKTLALGDYAVTVNEEIERNHNEVLFLYSMLSDKQKEIMTTAQMVDDYRKDVENFVNENAIPNAVDNKDIQLEEEINEMKESNDSDEENTEEEELEEVIDGNKDIILEMYKSGLSILEIARNLGLGVGEVKLVVDLYKGAAK